METPRIGKGKPGPGRPHGSKNKRTLEREASMQAAAQTIAAMIPDAFPGDAHALLVAIYKDPGQPVELRLDAAKAAIRFEKPALASTTVDASIRRSLADFTDAELAMLASDVSGKDGAAETLRSPH
jgi:hypothetical protein